MRIGSLFSGYGGLDLGVQSVLGGEVCWHVECEEDPSRILEHHFPGVPNYGDVRSIQWSTVEPVDVLTGGYPCQPFSSAGLRKGTTDERHLWPEVFRAIREVRPRLVVLENVRGHLSLGFADVLSDLASVGWSARWGVVRACDAGAPHQRSRLFIIAYPNGAARTQCDVRATGRESASRRLDSERHNLRRTDWGDYAAAVARWEQVLRRSAPGPTEPGRTRATRLSPRFVEWMMGLPEGWVTDPAIGISRAGQLDALGNGVVPQQAALALAHLLPISESEEAA